MTLLRLSLIICCLCVTFAGAVSAQPSAIDLDAAAPIIDPFADPPPLPATEQILQEPAIDKKGPFPPMPQPIAAAEGRDADKFLGILVLDAICAFHCTGQETPVPLYEAPSDLPQEPAAWLRPDNILVPALTDYDYEEPGASVFEVRERDWYRIRFNQRDLWVKDSQKYRQYEGPGFLPYPNILMDRLAYIDLTKMPGGAYDLYEAPGSTVIRPLDRNKFPPALSDQNKDEVNVIGVATINGEAWVHVEIPSYSACDPDAPQDIPPPLHSGWLRAYQPDERGVPVPALWFYSRGC